MNKFVCGMIGTVLGAGGALAAVYIYNKSFKKPSYEARYRHYYTIMNQWMEKRNDGGSVTEYLLENGCRTIVIYGAGTMAARLYEEIKDNPEIKILYIIDKNQAYFPYDAEVVGLDGLDSIDGADAVIVTPVYDFDAIQEDLSPLTDAPIISLEELIY